MVGWFWWVAAFGGREETWDECWGGMGAAFPLRRTTPRSTHARAGRAELSLYLEPVVEAELMESAELVRADLTRSLWGNRWSAFLFSGKLGDISWLAWCVPWGKC